MPEDPGPPPTTSHGLEERAWVIASFRANHGQVGGRHAGVPIILVTARGAKSGIERTFPIAYTKDAERLIIVASLGGAPRHPQWYHNLVANPVVTVECAGEIFPAKVIVIAGSERQRLFDAHAARYPVFHEYQSRTSRVIPVIALAPVRSDVGGALR